MPGINQHKKCQIEYIQINLAQTRRFRIQIRMVKMPILQNNNKNYDFC